MNWVNVGKFGGQNWGLESGRGTFGNPDPEPGRTRPRKKAGHPRVEWSGRVKEKNAQKSSAHCARARIWPRGRVFVQVGPPLLEML